MHGIQRRKNLDFMKVERQRLRHQAVKRRGKSMLLLLPVVVLFFCLQVSIYDGERTEEIYEKIAGEQQFQNHAKQREENERLERLIEEIQLLDQYEKEAAKLEARSVSRPVLTLELIEQVEAAMGDTVELAWESGEPIRYADGILTFTAQVRSAKYASQYLERLAERTVFAQVEYSGFERRMVKEETLYLFEVQCTLAVPSIGEEEAG